MVKKDKALKNRRVGILAIDFHVLAEMLKLPPDHTIERTICPSNDFNGGDQVKLVVRGPQMPEVEESRLIPTVLGVLKRNPDGSYEFMKFQHLIT